jgi:hypothetical protein
MRTNYQARWISRQRADRMRRTGKLEQALLLDTFNGFIVVEPVGSQLGDGAILTPEEADYELQAAWHSGPLTKLREARNRLGLESAVLAAAGA